MMSDSKTPYFEKVSRKAEEYSRQLSSEDPRFKTSTVVTHHDGHDYLMNSFMVKYVGKGRGTLPPCLVVISEHFGPRVYPMDDVDYFATLENSKISALRESFEDPEDEIYPVLEEHDLEIS